MISKKYLKDYRLEEQINDNGRIRTKAVYIGGDYSISPKLSTAEKRLILGFSALSGILFPAALLPVSQAARVMYIILPFVLAALPIFTMIPVVVTLLHKRGSMKREHAERIAGRLPACAFLTMIFTAAAFIGLIITAAVSWESFPAGDIIFAVLSFIVCAASAVILMKCRNMKAVIQENQTTNCV